MFSFSQRPGALENFINEILHGTGIDIIRFEYLKRSNRTFGQVLIGFELQKKEDLEILTCKLKDNNYNFKLLDPEDPVYKAFI